MIARDLIAGAVLAALKAGTPVAQHVLHGELLDNLPEGAESAVAVDLGDTSVNLPDTVNTPFLDCTTPLRIDCFRRNDTAAAVDGRRPSSVLQAAAHARMESVRDADGLGILTFDLVRFTADRSLQDARRGVLTAVYQIEHRINAATLEPLED